MTGTTGKILVVDDEAFNLEILTEQLDDAGYVSISAADGLQAWRLLQQSPQDFDAILLDRMMPQLDGLEVLRRIKQHPQLDTVPVILQTAKAARDEILEGLQAGAYYYLTKPFDQDTLLAVVKTAVGDFQRYRNLQRDAARLADSLALMEQARFGIRTLGQARDLAALLAEASPQGKRLLIGLSELLINAVEHGNLGIGYAEKTALNERGEWLAEVERRQALPEYSAKQVFVEYHREDSQQRFLIRDQGAGFDWRGYLEISPERAFDNHGRGIAVAKSLSFDSVEYLGCGNEVLAVVNGG